MHHAYHPLASGGVVVAAAEAHVEKLSSMKLSNIDCVLPLNDTIRFIGAVAHHVDADAGPRSKPRQTRNQLRFLVDEVVAVPVIVALLPFLVVC